MISLAVFLGCIGNIFLAEMAEPPPKKLTRTLVTLNLKEFMH